MTSVRLVKLDEKRPKFTNQLPPRHQILCQRPEMKLFSLNAPNSYYKKTNRHIEYFLATASSGSICLIYLGLKLSYEVLIRVFSSNFDVKN